MCADIAPPGLSGNDNECAELEMVGIHRWGSYADYTSVHEDQLHALPDGLALGEAAALAATGPSASPSCAPPSPVLDR